MPKKEIFALFIPYINRLKLRQLDIHISNMNHVEMVLDRFRDLLSVTFRFRPSNSITNLMIIEYVRTLVRDFSIVVNSSSVSIWRGLND